MGRIAALRRSSPLAVRVGVVAASVGVIYGYDLSNIAGALLFIETDLQLSSGAQELVATATVIGEILGALGAGWLANAIGRKRTMVLVVVGYALFALAGAAAGSAPTLVAARLLLGVTIGVSVVVVPVYVAESAPTAARGSLLVGYGLATVIGIIAGYLVAYLLAGAHGWRAMLGLAAIPAAAVGLLLAPMPDTARWYLLNGRAAEARRTLRRVEPDTDADAELAAIAAALRAQRSGGVLRELLARPYLRATVFLVVLGFFVQITGINAIVYYSPRLFATMGFRGDFGLLILPALVQVAALAAMCVALALIDRVGRRPILLSGIAVMVAADLVLVTAFAAGSLFGDALAAVQFGGVVLFTVGYTVGFGALVWVYAGESLPARLRSMGSSLMLTSDLVANAIVVGVFLTALTALGGAATFAVFAVLAIAGFGFVYRYAPETKGRQLEDIRQFWENGGRWPTVPAGEPACR